MHRKKLDELSAVRIFCKNFQKKPKKVFDFFVKYVMIKDSMAGKDMKKQIYERLKRAILPKIEAHKAWFLSLLDPDAQKTYEDGHMRAVMSALRYFHVQPRKIKIERAKEEIKRIQAEEEKNAENYCKVTALLQEIKENERAIDVFKPFFDEPYFARMDLEDPMEGYNSYYIGKKGDEKLEIVDWRAPLARRYYQKSKIRFTINEYDYKTVLRRALKTKNGQVEDFKNEFLSVKDYLTSEEIGGRDEEILFDPYLREIIKSRKDEAGIKDIIETIQEKQYAIITCEENKNFVLQGSAGSGKTMIMLHRLSYLMYNNEGIKARDVLMLTPSDSFNAFIDELSAVLELERVRTTTVHDYFLQVLKNEKIDLKGKIDYSAKEGEDYLAYLYSPKFTADLTKKLSKVYDSLFGLFTGKECEEFIADILNNCKTQLSLYEGIKNSSLRVRRAVLGEIKEKKEGGLYYTKPFRALMNGVLEIEDFFGGTLNSDHSKNPSYFYRQLIRFYKSATFVAKQTDDICEEAATSLAALQTEIEKEIVDLKRYKQRTGATEVYLHADRIRAKEGLLKEIVGVANKVRSIEERGYAFSEFYGYLRGEKNFQAVGGSGDFSDLVRFFYKETIKKYKLKYGLKQGVMYPSDAYALTKLCSLLGKELTPKHSFVFVDEAQDISEGEYELLRTINDRASFDIFGDLKQNITPYRGVSDWSKTFEEYEIFELNRNYRNTNQIVEFVALSLKTDMQPMGFDGAEVKYIAPREMHAFFKDVKGMKAVICSEKTVENYSKKSYNVLSKTGRLSKTKVNLMTVYESKGLEFSSVVAVADEMTSGEKYIAYTRALKELAVIDSAKK